MMLLTIGIFSTKEKETNVRKCSLKYSSHKFQMEILNELIIYFTLKMCVCLLPSSAQLNVLETVKNLIVVNTSSALTMISKYHILFKDYGSLKNQSVWGMKYGVESIDNESGTTCLTGNKEAIKDHWMSKGSRINLKRLPLVKKWVSLSTRKNKNSVYWNTSNMFRSLSS